MKKFIAVILVLLLLALAVYACAEPDAREVAQEAAPFQLDLTPLFQAILAALAALITGKLVPWINARLKAEQRAKLLAITRTLVYAAEQLYKTGTVKDRLQYVERRLREKGYAIDRDLIEAQVREMANNCIMLEPIEEGKPWITN